MMGRQEADQGQGLGSFGRTMEIERFPSIITAALPPGPHRQAGWSVSDGACGAWRLRSGSKQIA